MEACGRQVPHRTLAYLIAHRQVGKGMGWGGVGGSITGN